MPITATIWPMEIDGKALRAARKAAGYRSQSMAAQAVGIGSRTFGDWERDVVPEEYVSRVRETFWPHEGTVSPAITTFTDLDLLNEVGRRFAEYRRQAEQFEENLASSTNPGSGDVPNPVDNHRSSTPTSGTGPRTGRRGRRHLED